MNEQSGSQTGGIIWIDLTVDDAESIRQFYAQVVGWSASPLDMGGYNDFNVHGPEGGDPVAGICHARGSNADLPPVWLIYITVDDVDTSAEECVRLGGKILDGPREMGSRRFCVIQDPAGAISALITP